MYLVEDGLYGERHQAEYIGTAGSLRCSELAVRGVQPHVVRLPLALAVDNHFGEHSRGGHHIDGVGHLVGFQETGLAFEMEETDAPETAAYEMAYFFNALEITG